MVGFFRSAPYAHPTLGTFERRRGRWVGAATLPPFGAVELRLAGSRAAPDAAALDAALALPAQWSAARDAVQEALWEHYEPGLESWQRGELDDLATSFPELARPADVWPQLRVVCVDVDPGRRAYPVEVRLTTTWDEEHTLGARLAGARLVELCGSVGP